MLRRFPIVGRGSYATIFFAKIQGQKKGFSLQSLTQGAVRMLLFYYFFST